MAYSKDDLPFALHLKSMHGQDTVICEQLLRDLPGKRQVFKALWRRRAVVVKLFLDPKTARRHCGREKVGIEALQETSVPTPELLFAGELEDGTPALIFDFLAEAETALLLWDNLSTSERMADFLHQFVELVADLHEAGLIQEDLHLENFLVSKDRIHAIDGAAVRIRNAGKPLGMKASSRNLALLFAQLSPVHDELIGAAVLAYAQQRKLSSQHLLERLQHDLPVVRRRRRRKYIAKCTRTCSEFVRTRMAGRIAMSRRDQQGDALAHLLDDPDTFMQCGEILKDGLTSTVVRVRGDGYDWVVKRYNIKGFCHAVRRGFRPTRASTSWRNAHRLKISGIATPRAVAMIEKRFGPLRSTGYYVCDFVDAANTKQVLLNPEVSDAEKQLLARKYVQLFGLFRQLRIHHGDCKAHNFLYKNNQLWVLDLDAMRECSTAVVYERLFRTDRRRFLRNWETQPELQKWFDERLPD